MPYQYEPRQPFFGHGGLHTVGPNPPLPSRSSNHQYQHRRPIQPPNLNRYGNRAIHIHTPLCHAIYPPCLIDDPLAQERFIKEQWYLARPSAPSLASQHQARRVLLNVREQKYAWLTLIGFFLGLVFGARRAKENIFPPPEPRRPLGPINWENVKGAGKFLFVITGEAVGFVYQKMRKINWNKVWQAAAFLYMVYILGKPDEKSHQHTIPSRARAISKTSQPGYESVRYGLVPEARGWCEYSYELSGEVSADKSKQGVSGNFRRSRKRGRGVKGEARGQMRVVDGHLGKGWRKYADY